MSYMWNWGIFFQLSPDGTHTYLQLLLFGAGWTLATALLAWVIALSAGAVVGVIRTAPVPWLVPPPAVSAAASGTAGRLSADSRPDTAAASSVEVAVMTTSCATTTAPLAMPVAAAAKSSR